MLVIGNVAHDLLAFTVGGPQVLLASVLIFSNNGVGRIENGLGGAIVLLQQDGMRLRVVALEFLNIADGRTTEGINGLVGVAHHAQLGRVRAELSPAHERSNQRILGVVGVLVLVNKHVLKAPPIKFHHLLVLGEDPHHLTDEIIKVYGVSRAQAALVFGIDLGHGGLKRVFGLLRLLQRRFRTNEFVFVVRNLIGKHARGVLFQIQLHVLGNHGQKPAGVIAIVDGEVGIKAWHKLRVLAQDAHADGVEGRYPHALGHGANQPAHALLHFRGGLISKGNGEDLPRIYPAMAHEIGNAAGKHRCLAGTGARHDEQRAARVGNGL